MTNRPAQYKTPACVIRLRITSLDSEISRLKSLQAKAGSDEEFDDLSDAISNAQHTRRRYFHAQQQ